MIRIVNLFTLYLPYFRRQKCLLLYYYCESKSTDMSGPKLNAIISRLPLETKKVVKKVDNERGHSCVYCAFKASATKTLTRHSRLRHFALSAQPPSSCFCPARSCSFSSSSAEVVKAHLTREHPNPIRVKTIVHENLEDEEANLVDLTEDGGGSGTPSPEENDDWEVLPRSDSDSGTETVRPLSIRKRKLSSTFHKTKETRTAKT